MPPSRSELIRLLTDFRPIEQDEQEYRVRMLDLAAVANEPFSRYQYKPGHFTASGFIVHPKGDRMLLVHHQRLGIWVQPGGHVEPDDPTVLDAALREIAEETGIVEVVPVSPGLADIDIHVFPETADQPGHLHFDLRFAFVAPDGRVSALDGVIDARWVGLDGLADLGVGRSITRPLTKLLGVGNSGPAV
jgi:8-oxo-dGTP pyrophosphatase MutT (NUDIX family)